MAGDYPPGGDRFDRDRGDRGDRGDRRGPRDRDREPGSYSVMSRLRAKARKKARKQARRLFTRKKVSRFSADPTIRIDWKDAKLLRSFLTETGKIIPRRISGNTAVQQRKLAIAVKRARQMALLPYTDSHQ